MKVPLSLSLEKTYEDYSISTASEREQAFGQYDHVRIYAEDYYERLKEAGFQVNQFRWWEDNRNFGGPKNRCGLIENESVVIAVKV